MKTRIIGTGSSVPEQVVTNEDLTRMLDTSDEWITSRTGIKKRRIALTETAASMASQAAKRALDNAKCKAEDIDAIIVATSSPDYTFPSTASMVQANIKANHAFCFDISVACTGFLYGLHMADAYIRSETCKKVLIIGSEVMSTAVDWKDRSVCVLFGDGAGAVVVGADEHGILNACLCTDGSKGNVLTYRELQQSLHQEKKTYDYIKMNGQEVFTFALKKVPESIQTVTEQAGVAMDQIKYFILHQANIRIIQSVAKRLGMPMSQFPSNLSEYGNTSAASIPILLDELNRKNLLKEKDKLVLSGFGAGLCWGSMLLEW